MASFERVITTKRPDTVALLRFDIPKAGAGQRETETRHWSLVHAPILDAAGEVAFVIQHALDVTELERMREAMGDASARAPQPEPAHVGIFDGRTASIEQTLRSRRRASG